MTMRTTLQWVGLVVICGIKCAVVAVLVVVVAAVVPVAAAAAVVVEIVEAAEEYGTWASARSSLIQCQELQVVATQVPITPLYFCGSNERECVILI
eukprot:scaffold175458_cov45-Cyclotella_meneghiniana.AAC.1